MIFNSLADMVDGPQAKLVRELENQKLREAGVDLPIDEIYILTGASDEVISFVRKSDLSTIKTMWTEDFIGGTK